jgi:hypothetical protein
MLSGTSFIGAPGGNMMICFHKKKMPFYFIHPRDPNTRSRSQKVRSLKDFEVRSVPKKEPLHNRQKAINPFSTVISLK